MNKLKCTKSKKPYFSGYYLRLFCTGLILLPIALTLTLTRKFFHLIHSLRLRRPIIKEPVLTKEPVRFIRSPAMTEIDDWNYEDLDEEKKTEEWLKLFNDPQVLESARWFCEYQFSLKPNPKIPYNEYDDPLY